VESLTPPDEVNELDHYIFVIRTRIGEYPGLCPGLNPDSKADKSTEKQIHYIDIKSEGLRDVLRSVLQDVKGICLREGKPSVQLPLAFQ
jgi:hypothetical protein